MCSGLGRLGDRGSRGLGSGLGRHALGDHAGTAAVTTGAAAADDLAATAARVTSRSRLARDGLFAVAAGSLLGTVLGEQAAVALVGTVLGEQAAVALPAAVAAVTGDRTESPPTRAMATIAKNIARAKPRYRFIRTSSEGTERELRPVEAVTN